MLGRSRNQRIRQSGKSYRPVHFLKCVVHEKLFDFFDDYLFDDDIVEIDFNFIEIRNGKEETLIDYMDLLIKENDKYYDIDELVEVRDALIEDYGAKRARELK